MTPAKKAVPSLAELSKKDDDKSVQDKTPEMEQNQTDLISQEKNEDPDFDSDASHFDQEEDKENEPFLSPTVVGTVPNKTPAELSAETPDETASRYGIDQSITDEDADNPRVQVYRDTKVNQVPSGTHLHPDIAKDLLNRGISEQHTDNAQVKRAITEAYDFAPDAEFNDKFQKPDVDEDGNEVL